MESVYEIKFETITGDCKSDNDRVDQILKKVSKTKKKGKLTLGDDQEIFDVERKIYF
jgi:hypothetical protein